jgi:hypothetical protein
MPGPATQAEGRRAVLDPLRNLPVTQQNYGFTQFNSIGRSVSREMELPAIALVSASRGGLSKVLPHGSLLNIRFPSFVASIGAFKSG